MHGSTRGRWTRTRPVHGADSSSRETSRDETSHLQVGAALAGALPNQLDYGQERLGERRM
jgi:hypothetical protein